jgi:glycosyltransferase involved in cell wall biosynthesis
MNALISIIIPVFNHAKIIGRSVESIKNQTYRPLELIIVNDGSTDNFDLIEKKLLDDVELKQLNIKIISQENLGAPTARNNGFSLSGGEYVIFWDADTIAEPTMLEKMKQTLEAHPNDSYVYCDFKFGWKKFVSQKFDQSTLKINNYIDTTSLIRRNDFPGFDRSLKRFQDWDLWLTMAEIKKTGAYLPEILYKKLIGRRKGISAWLPKIFFKLPWKTRAVLNYQSARQVIAVKHGLKLR